MSRNKTRFDQRFLHLLDKCVRQLQRAQDHFSFKFDEHNIKHASDSFIALTTKGYMRQFKSFQVTPAMNEYIEKIEAEIQQKVTELDKVRQDTVQKFLETQIELCKTAIAQTDSEFLNDLCNHFHIQLSNLEDITDLELSMLEMRDANRTQDNPTGNSNIQPQTVSLHFSTTTSVETHTQVLQLAQSEARKQALSYITGRPKIHLAATFRTDKAREQYQKRSQTREKRLSSTSRPNPNPNYMQIDNEDDETENPNPNHLYYHPFQSAGRSHNNNNNNKGRTRSRQPTPKPRRTYTQPHSRTQTRTNSTKRRSHGHLNWSRNTGMVSPQGNPNTPRLNNFHRNLRNPSSRSPSVNRGTNFDAPNRNRNGNRLSPHSRSRTPTSRSNSNNRRRRNKRTPSPKPSRRKSNNGFVNSTNKQRGNRLHKH